METPEHVKTSCDCGHSDSAHVDRVAILGSGEHSIGCRECDMERDVFPIGFLNALPPAGEARRFLVEQLNLQAADDDLDRAAREAYLRLPAYRRQNFDHAWRKLNGETTQQ